MPEQSARRFYVCSHPIDLDPGRRWVTASVRVMIDCFLTRSPPIRTTRPARCFRSTPHRASGWTAPLLKRRERTAGWQLCFCILLTWHGCSTTRDKRTFPARSKPFGPVGLSRKDMPPGHPGDPPVSPPRGTRSSAMCEPRGAQVYSGRRDLASADAAGVADGTGLAGGEGSSDVAGSVGRPGPGTGAGPSS